MKSLSRLLTLLGIFFASLATAQTGDSCLYAYDLGIKLDTCTPFTTVQRPSSWFTFTGMAPQVTITLTNTSQHVQDFDRLVLYSGSCGTLTPIDSIDRNPGDSVIVFTRNFLPVAVQYFIEAKQITSVACRDCDFVTSNLCLKQTGGSPYCGFDFTNAFTQSNNPGYTIQMTAQDQYLFNYVHSHSQIAGPFTIPVVVHVVHFGEAYGTGNNISYDQILWQIAGMNAAFQRDYAAYNQETYGHNYQTIGQQDYSSDPQVRFCLATIGRDSVLNQIPFFYNTMSGDTECGVVRYDLTQAPFSSVPNVGTLNEFQIDTNAVDEQALIDVTRPGTEFPNGMYFNIYIVPDLCSGTGCDNQTSAIPGIVGIGSMVASPVAGLDGVVIRGDAFGDNSVTGNTFPLFQPLENGKIMDHEAGHYLALYHTFQPDSGFNVVGCYGDQDSTATSDQCDENGDFCCDTPPDTHAVVLPFMTVSTLNTCNETYFTTNGPDHRDMNENYMDYSDDEWYNTFTFSQSMRISAMLDTLGPRHSLVTPMNLALTGVADTGSCHCCVLAAHIVPQNDSTCPGAAVSMFTPSGVGFCATSWQWQFPGGSPSTATGTNTSVIYNAPGNYWVYLTATNGTDTVLDSALIHVVVPTVTISATNTTDTVCSETHQHLELDFTGGLQPYNITICDQNNNVVATRNNIFCDSAVILVPVTLTSNQFFICSATNGLGCTVDTIIGNAAFLVQECCANLFVNGDFEAIGVPGCNISPSTSELPCGSYSTNRYYTYDPTVNTFGWPVVPPVDGQNGLSMVIDCPPTPNHLTPIRNSVVWSQVVNLEQGVHYSLQFDYSSHYGNLGTTSLSPYLNSVVQLYLQFQVNGVFIGTPVNVEHCNRGEVWHTFVMDWVNTFPTGIDTIKICQVEAPPAFDINFSGGGFDFLLDNISIRAMDIPVALAGTDTTICTGTFADIGSPLNDVDGAYLWSPNTFVTCDTCFFTTANPNSAIQYVLQNQQRGCTVFDTVQVYILDVDAGNDTAFCGSGSVTLTATVTGNPAGHNTIWQPGGQTTDVITVSPSVTTTYIVTVSDSLSTCSVSDTITVYPSNVSVSVNSPKICAGDAAMLSASVTGQIGGLTYQWLPGNQTTSSISVSPTVNTTYTVVVTDSVGCSDTAISVVTVNSASVTASATPNPACIGSFIQLQATPLGLAPFAYTWLPTTNLINPSTANPTINAYNGTTITYTVFIADANGCSATDSVQITLDPTCCTAQFTTPDTLFSSITGGQYAMNQDMYISGTVTLNGVDMLIGSNHTITVLSGSTLVINGQSHLHACLNMWQGIDLRPGATLVVTQNSLIEDAFVAVNCVNAPGANIQLVGAIFNKNQIAVLAQQWTGTLAFNMQSCRVTCRALPTNPTVGMLTPAFLTSLPQATMLPPLSTQRGFSGVQVMNGGQITIGNPIANGVNIFDYLDHGVVGNNTNIIIRNNHFQNMLKPCTGPPSCPSTTGIAVVASDPGMIPGNASTYNQIDIGGSGTYFPNTFVNCWKSIDITRYVVTNVTYNSIFSTSTVIAPPNMTNLNGDHGIFIRTTYSVQMNVNNNMVRNQARGIHINLSAGGLGYNTINIRDNVVKAGNAATTFTTTGIQVDGISGVFFTTGNYLNIEGDSVLNASVCVQVRNVRNGVRVFSNPELRVRPNTTTTPGPNKGGIFIQNCNAVLIQDNLNINSLGTVLDSNNRNIRGIYVFNSGQSVICNNAIRHFGQCMVFEGSCANATIRKNDFSFAYDGFVLRNSAVIGPQGNSLNPWDCRWLTGFVHSHTYTQNTIGCNTNSPIWVRNTGWWTPTINVTNNPGNQYSPNPVSTGYTPASCGPTPALMAMQQTLRQQIAQDEIDYAVYPDENRVANQKRLYKEIDEDPLLMTGDTILQNFHTHNQYDNLGLIAEVDEETEQGNSANATNSNSGINATTNPEWNQKQFNAIFLATLMQGIDTVTAQELSDLMTIAEQCPNIGGDAVWQARAMLDWVLHTALDFSDSCNASNARYVGNSSSTENTGGHVFPNPNAGTITVECNLQNNDEATFEVLDLTGRIVFSVSLDPKLSQQMIELPNLANGPYIYKIIGDAELKDTGTLIINR